MQIAGNCLSQWSPSILWQSNKNSLYVPESCNPHLWGVAYVSSDLFLWAWFWTQSNLSLHDFGTLDSRPAPLIYILPWRSFKLAFHDTIRSCSWLPDSERLSCDPSTSVHVSTVPVRFFVASAILYVFLSKTLSILHFTNVAMGSMNMLDVNLSDIQ